MRVLLIDDHAIVREGLRALLEDEAEVEVVGEAASTTSIFSITAGEDVALVSSMS